MKRKASPPANLPRCPWAKSELYIAYHDQEWGMPVHDDRTLFEFLILEGAQAGLSWETILRKRENYRAVVKNSDARRVASYDERKSEKLLGDAGIIRNRLKVNSAVRNAQAFLDIQKEFGSFDKYVWRFVNGRTIKRQRGAAQAHTLESDALSRDLMRRGFKFVGSTICYSFMQAVGMVNDHIVTCFRYNEVSALRQPRMQGGAHSL